MSPTITTALVGLLLLSNSTGTPGTTWTKQPDEAPSYPAYTVSMTGYNAVPGQTDDTPDVTASGTKPIPNVTAARSQDLSDELPFGTVIKIDPADAASQKSCGLSALDGDLGYRVITDSMHPRKHDQIDIVFGTDDTVRAGGRKMNAAKVLGLCPGVSISVIGYLDVTKLPGSQKELAALVEKASSLAFNK